MNVFDSLKTKQADAQRGADAAWNEAVVQFAADPTTATEKAVTAVLKLAGKVVDELQVAVARQTRINELRVEIAEYPAAVAEHVVAGNELHEFIKENGITQKALEEASSIPQSQISRLRKVSRAEFATLNKLLPALSLLTGREVGISDVLEYMKPEDQK